MSISPREARAIIRKAKKRVPEGEEVRHLNVMPLVAIASILLLAVTAQTAIQNYHTIGDLELPESESLEPETEEVVTLLVSENAILVDGEAVVPVQNGAVDSSFKEDGALSMKIPRLSRALGLVRADNERRMRERGREPPEEPELVIIADGSTPYRLLFELIVSARDDEAGFDLFQLLVVYPEGAGAEPGGLDS